MEDLKRLPFRVIQAKVTGEPGRLVEVLVDGDYDGEWFAGLPWRIVAGGYVAIAANRQMRLFESVGGIQYLHHFVLPPKVGYVRTHLNDNLLDNRSCNIGYATMKERMIRREDEKRIRNFTAMQYRLKNPRKE